MVERQNRPFRKRRHANGHWVVEPLPDAEELARLYDESYYTPESAAAEYLPTYGDEELRHKRLMAECSLELASRDLKICSDQLRLLDVGCGEGFVMAAAAARGWSVAGIDFTTAGVARHHPELLAHVSVGDWQTLLASLPPASVDLCCLANVVEHVREPDALLRRTASLLAPDGRLVVAVPNDDNLLQRLARECRHIHSDPWFCPPEHLSYFNTATFASFAKVAGLQILDMITTFPIEAFLFSPGSNYVETPSLGKHVHRGRIQIESALMGRDMHGYQAMGRAQARLGIGRNIIAVLQPA